MGELRHWRFNENDNRWEGDFIPYRQTELTPYGHVTPAIRIYSTDVLEVRDNYDYYLIEKKNGAIYIAYKDQEFGG